MTSKTSAPSDPASPKSAPAAFNEHGHFFFTIAEGNAFTCKRGGDLVFIVKKILNHAIAAEKTVHDSIQLGKCAICKLSGFTFEEPDSRKIRFLTIQGKQENDPFFL